MEPKETKTKEIQIAGRTITIHDDAVTLFIVGHNIVQEAFWSSAPVVCSYYDIIQAACGPPDPKRPNNPLDAQTHTRVFSDYEEALSQLSSKTFGHLSSTRHGNPLVTVLVSWDVLRKWKSNALTKPIDGTRTGFAIPFPEASNMTFLTAEFKGTLFSPLRMHQSTGNCIIL